MAGEEGVGVGEGVEEDQCRQGAHQTGPEVHAEWERGRNFASTLAPKVIHFVKAEQNEGDVGEEGQEGHHRLLKEGNGFKIKRRNSE